MDDDDDDDDDGDDDDDDTVSKVQFECWSDSSSFSAPLPLYSKSWVPNLQIGTPPPTPRGHKMKESFLELLKRNRNRKKN